MSKFADKYGQWAVVTGASSGIGREFATVLAQKGMNLVLVARREQKLNDLSIVLKKDGNIEVKVVVADLSQKSGIGQLVTETSTLDVGLLVNNVGREDSGYFLDIPIEEATATLNLNCKVPLELTYHYAQKMRDKGRGGIVFMSSLVSYQGVPFVANYAGTKAYNLIFAESIGAELKKFNIDVIAATPGFTDTELARDWNFSGLPMKPLAASYVANKVISKLGKKRIVIPGAINCFLYFTGKYLQTRKFNTFAFGLVFKRVLRDILR